MRAAGIRPLPYLKVGRGSFGNALVDSESLRAASESVKIFLVP